MRTDPKISGAIHRWFGPAFVIRPVGLSKTTAQISPLRLAIMKKAFTLIELLVVIAIIAILAAILFPVFAQAKLAAKKTQSLSNQKQHGLGILMYAGDYDDRYPRQDGCTLNDSFNPAFNNKP